MNTRKNIFRHLDYRILGAMAFLVSGLFFFAIYSQRYSLSCTRSESGQLACFHERAWLGLIPTKQRSIEGLSGARLRQICDPYGCVAFVELDTAEGPYRLSGGFSNNPAPEIETVEEINAFLTMPTRPALEVVVIPRASELILPITFSLGGLFFLCSWIFRVRKTNVSVEGSS